MSGSEDGGVEAIGGDVVPFFLETGIVSSLLGFQTQEPSLPKEESMPVLSALERFFSYLSVAQLSRWYKIF
jgi:hypothetical protein